MSIDYAGENSIIQLITEIKGKIPTDIPKRWYGECTTAQTTTAKVVTITGFTSANLVKGTIITVKFSNAAHASSAQTLNVSGTGAKSIVKYGSTSSAGGWVANQTITLAYDGTYWRMVDYQQNTDANVKQTLNSNTNASYPILFKGDTTTQEKTQGTQFNGNATINPSTGTITANKLVGDGSGLTNIPVGYAQEYVTPAQPTNADKYSGTFSIGKIELNGNETAINIPEVGFAYQNDYSVYANWGDPEEDLQLPNLPPTRQCLKNTADRIATDFVRNVIPDAISGKQNTLTAGSNITISGNTISAVDTTYSSKSASSGGTAVSLCTTGEKYTWNNKGTYSKPSGGIPKMDLASAVQTSLGKADSAIQDISGKQDKLTTAQLNACSSGVTANKVSAYDGYASRISALEDNAVIKHKDYTVPVVNGIANIVAVSTHNNMVAIVPRGQIRTSAYIYYENLSGVATWSARVFDPTTGNNVANRNQMFRVYYL